MDKGDFSEIRDHRTKTSYHINQPGFERFKLNPSYSSQVILVHVYDVGHKLWSIKIETQWPVYDNGISYFNNLVFNFQSEWYHELDEKDVLILQSFLL